jgi:DNA-binding HxlR family transcriptional regulator
VLRLVVSETRKVVCKRTKCVDFITNLNSESAKTHKHWTWPEKQNQDVGDTVGHPQMISDKKRDGIISARVRKSMSIPRGHKDRREEQEARVLYHQHPGEEDHSVQFAIALIQGKWKIGILSTLQSGPARLSQLCRRFPEATKKMLTQHLREMERDGLIVRTDLSGRIKHVEYSLSGSRGFAVLQLINVLTEWGSIYAPARAAGVPTRRKWKRDATTAGPLGW